jgi:hypothetical protein
MYSLYEVAVKRAAQDYVNVQQQFLNAVGNDDFHDEEESFMFFYAQTICAFPPTEWRQKLQCKHGRIGENVLGFLEWQSIQNYMYPPYTQDDALILSPVFLRN